MQNPSFFGDRRAFTLVEMLVVIAIISMVAMASVTSIKSAQRQARSAKCQANMHTLYNAAVAFRADNSYFPPASGYEVFDSRNDKYSQYRGWVTWVRPGAERARKGDSGNKYKGSGNTDAGQKASHASAYVYVGTGADKSDYTGASGNAPNYGKVNDSRVYRSIDEGALFVYADKNFSAYCCDEFKARYGKQCMRSYAMNQCFGSRRYRRYPPCWDVPSEHPDRMAMFVEIGNAGSKNKDPLKDLTTTVGGGRTGTAGDTDAPKDIFGDDSVWDWDKNSAGGNDGAGGENIGVLHRKSGKLYGHVVFADGHLESLELPKSTTDQQKQRRSLGKGELLAN